MKDLKKEKEKFLYLLFLFGDQLMTFFDKRGVEFDLNKGF